MASSETPSLGVLGTGHLATYTVTGLRRSGDTRKILLSPRNAERAAHLATNFDCEIAADNQTLVNACDLILIAVRPDQLIDLLSSMTIPADKVVISAVAGVSIERLREQAELPQRLARILPTVCAENSKGMVPVYPALTEATELAARLGEAVVFDKQQEFELASTMACLNGWMYRFYGEQVAWLMAQGLDQTRARTLVLHNALGAAEYGLGRPEQSMEQLWSEIATEGTFTRRGLEQLESDQAFASWSRALDTMKSALG